MKNIKLIFVFIIVAAGIWYFVYQKPSHDPVYFQNVEYKYNDSTQNNGVVNYFYTTDSERPKQGDNYIQVVDLSGIKVTPQIDHAIQAQISNSYNLRKINEGHFFGRFRNSLPIFMIKRPSSYLIYVNGSNSTKPGGYFSGSVRDEIFDNLDNLSISEK